MDNEKRSLDIKKILLIVVGVIAVICVTVTAIFFVVSRDDDDGDGSGTISLGVVSEIETSIDWEAYQETWQAKYAINSDYIGDLVFTSGLVAQPVVQYIDDDDITQGYYKYLRTNWETMEDDEEGTVFLDPYGDIDGSMNLVFYGHYVYEEYDETRTHMFTPLAQLLDEENYEENAILYLLLEDEIRVYQVAHVYIAQLYSSTGDSYDMLDDGMYYMFPDWTEEELEYFLEQISEIEEYDTGVEIEYGDRWITLQTCVDGHDDQREIVIAKEIAVIEVGESTDLLIDFVFAD